MRAIWKYVGMATVMGGLFAGGYISAKSKYHGEAVDAEKRVSALEEATTQSFDKFLATAQRSPFVIKYEGGQSFVRDKVSGAEQELILRRGHISAKNPLDVVIRDVYELNDAETINTAADKAKAYMIAEATGAPVQKFPPFPRQ